jgi:hypothetical protein
MDEGSADYFMAVKSTSNLIIQILDSFSIDHYCPRQHQISWCSTNTEDFAMRHVATHSMNREDLLISKVLFGFLTTPLLLLMSAAAVIAL